MYQFVTSMLRPFGLLYLLTGLAILNLWRRRRESRRRLILVSASFACAYLVSLPVAGYLALGSLEWSNPPLEAVPEDAEAYVVLGGYVFAPNSAHGSPDLSPETISRCLCASRLFKRKPLPVLVSGGRVNPGRVPRSVAEYMRDFLGELGVPKADVIVEGRSLSTYENALEGARLLKAAGFDKIVLITNADHMERAARCFRKQGLAVVPSPCHYRALEFDFSILSFVPSPAAAIGVLDASHEWLGLLWYRLQGRI